MTIPLWCHIEPISYSHGYNPGPVCRDHLKIFLSGGNDGSPASKTANDGNSASATSNGTQGKVLQSTIDARSAN